MKEQNRLRLARSAERYRRRTTAEGQQDTASFATSFIGLCERLLRPQMEEIAAELLRAGHSSAVELREDGPEGPTIELSIRLTGSPRDEKLVGFSVIHWPGEPMQILAYLQTSGPPFDIERFASADEIGADRVEQLLVDAVEQILAAST